MTSSDTKALREVIIIFFDEYFPRNENKIKSPQKLRHRIRTPVEYRRSCLNEILAQTVLLFLFLTIRVHPLFITPSRINYLRRFKCSDVLNFEKLPGKDPSYEVKLLISSKITLFCLIYAVDEDRYVIN